MTAPPLRVGLVGCGSVALTAHVPALLDLPDDYRAVAIADPTPALREQARAMLSLAPDHAHPSHRELIQREDVDVVLICTPPHIRAPILLDAVRAGVHVLSEKPLTIVPREAREVVAAARSAGVMLGLVHNYLYLPELVAARDVLRSGEIGSPEVAILNYLGVLDNPGSNDYEPGWRHRSAIAGGGVLMDMLHAVYVAEELLGEPIRRVSAFLGASADGAPVEEVALCRFETDGKVALVNIGWGFGPGGIQVSASNGRLIVHYQDDGTSPFYPPDSITVAGPSGPRPVPVPTPVATHRVALASYARALRRGVDPDAVGEDGQRVLEAVLAAYESAVTDRTVALPLAEDDPVFAAGVSGLLELRASASSRAVKRQIFGIHTNAGTRPVAATGVEA